MNYIQVVKDSVETSVSMKIFKNLEESSYAHIFKSKLTKIPLSKFKNVNNFNPERLKKSAIEAYPINNRPRGIKDVNSVKYYQKLIKENNNITPIWMIKKNKKFILLDGAHRIVASYIENKKYINSYLIIL